METCFLLIDAFDYYQRDLLAAASLILKKKTKKKSQSVCIVPIQPCQYTEPLSLLIRAAHTGPLRRKKTRAWAVAHLLLNCASHPSRPSQTGIHAIAHIEQRSRARPMN